MASNWDSVVAHEIFGEPTLRKNVLSIKASDTHRWPQSSGRIVIQQVGDVVLHREVPIPFLTPASWSVLLQGTRQV